MHIVDLIPELLLHIASFLTQIDLLNVSLTCKRLRDVTEPELYREYINPHMLIYQHERRSIRSFIMRLLGRPELSRYVRRVDLKAYSHLVDLNPELGPPSAMQYVECTSNEYQQFTQAAVASGIITDILPYEEESSIWKKLNSHEFQEEFNEGGARGWYEHIYDDAINIKNVPYDVQYCKLLRLGVEDAFVVLLMALLPNVRELDLYGAPHHPYSLPWRTNHRFRALRSFTASATDGELEWPLGFFKDVICGGNLRSLMVYFAGSAWREEFQEDFDFHGNLLSIPLELPLGSTKITRLMLQYCTFTKDQMRIILQACAALKSLYYSTGGQKVGPENFTFPDFVELLQPYKTSLEDLYLDLVEDWDFDRDAESLPSLRDFTALKTLDTNMHTWGNLLLAPLGPYEDEETQHWLDLVPNPLDSTAESLCDHLPPSLTTLIIQELESPVYWEFRQLEHLIFKRQEAMPNLRMIKCVEFEPGNITAVYRAFHKLVAWANANDDGFVFTLSSLDDYRRAHCTVFLTDGFRPRRATQYTRWKEDRYIHSLQRAERIAQMQGTRSSSP